MVASRVLKPTGSIRDRGVLITHRICDAEICSSVEQHLNHLVPSIHNSRMQFRISLLQYQGHKAISPNLLQSSVQPSHACLLTSLWGSSTSTCPSSMNLRKDLWSFFLMTAITSWCSFFGWSKWRSVCVQEDWRVKRTKSIVCCWSRQVRYN